MNTLVNILFILVPLLLSVAYLVYFERKVIGAIQLRHGPSVVGPFGLLQPFADAIKLLIKEPIIPFRANTILFIMAPMLTFILALIAWAVIPFGATENDQQVKVIANINVGVLYVLAVSSLGIYGIIIAGWSSNSNYAFLGAIRSAAQMISYEVSIGLIVATIVITTGTLNLGEMVVIKHNMPFWVDILLMPIAVVFFISLLAETNRHPFDLPEAEAELVSGYNVEYSSMPFALFFLGEYANMILASAMMTIFFLGGWYPPIELSLLYKIPGLIWFILKIVLLLFIFIWIRATIPRYRYDQLMRLGWKVFLPISVLWVVLVSGILLFTGQI
ncbi:NADH-quinone oxidoreductase subunit NuoH [Wolbachia endosymbiont of Atemnus politus]|uniref:NADH-quinone oxidoreductase subunit NuoH n=1 Tax=Wolbachia endosymbiont of Atemnus politus TaxID=2682840 RepID=UPI0015744105|nr:NADH-quinone oxidoreductase subunit NuoH [Wolbachia endosymbiont of Atemnus politus]NSM56286.1 NADH-quinone oxidoreductase subunit NuoH [Wolbachia endosymbiont of Atemnus politus]NSX83789.1 NADH-quinone oxidoreductase subunit NuoH [Wolbachia endosymbiont of Atemnus politus]